MADIFDYYPDNDLFKTYLTRSFAEIFPSAEEFLSEYKTSAVPKVITEDNVTTLYYLLYSKYGNSHIANSDENQFKYKIWSTIFMYGPTWEKRLEIQNKLRNLSDDDLLQGAIQIYNHSFDPGTVPSTIDTNELETVNDQKVSKYSRSKLDAYQFLYDLLKVDVSKSFLDRFKDLFDPFGPGLPLWYVQKEV